MCLAALLCDQLLPIRESLDFTVEGSQILNYLPPRAKNWCESTTRPLISQLSDSLQRTMHILNRLQQAYYLFPHSSETSKLGNLLKILVDLFWPRTSVLLDALERNIVLGEELDRYLDTSIRESQANEDIQQITTFRNTFALWQSQLRLETVCA